MLLANQKAGVTSIHQFVYFTRHRVREFHIGILGIYCEQLCFRGESIIVDFVGQTNDEFMNPMKYIYFQLNNNTNASMICRS